MLPLLAYALLVSHLQHNLPIFDDYIIQLELARLKAEPDLTRKLGILFSQLNKHFTSGHGFAGVLLAGVALVYQRRWRDTLYWTGMMLALFLLYFWSYNQPPNCQLPRRSTG